MNRQIAMMITMLFMLHRVMAEVDSNAGKVTMPESAAHSILPKDEVEYFGRRPQQFLLDPQQLLDSRVRRERLDFLKYHSSDSAIDLYFYVFREDQDLADGVMLERVMQPFFSDGRPAVVVAYFSGKPQRAKIYLSDLLKNVVPAIEQRRALESVVIQASKELSTPKQIEQFMVQMSIQIYWMEHWLNERQPAKVETQKIIRDAALAVDHKTKWLNQIDPVLNLFHPFGLQSAASILGLLVAGILHRLLKHRARYQFADLKVERRLGGQYAAGVGAVISFSSNKLSPASQKDQPVDYLKKM